MGTTIQTDASYPDQQVRTRTTYLSTVLILIAFVFSSCNLFSTREPEAPVDEAGTFLQPDTPEQVVENIRAAITELNTPNYGRSISTELTFAPTATAVALDPAIWSNWSQTDEQQYFSTMAAAAEFGVNHELRLSDETISIISDDRYDIDASYTLNVNHNRPDVPTTVQGRLIWVITQGPDGLWSLKEWTDREIGNADSWSTLKAEFVK